jgi:hypothetical protein
MMFVCVVRAPRLRNSSIRKSANMRDHIRWGASFQAIMAEFTTEQMEELREDCKNLIASARLLESAEYRTGAVPFDNDAGYEFVLERVAARLWSLEVVKLPPHAPKGVRVRAARRERETNERKAATLAPERTRRPRRTTLKRLLIVLHQRMLRCEFGHNLRSLTPALVAARAVLHAYCRSALAEMNAVLCSVQNTAAALLRSTQHYVENCERQGRIDTTPSLSSGMRLERRLFKIGRLEIPLNTWAPIDPGFDQIWDISVFGVRLVESERI